LRALRAVCDYEIASLVIVLTLVLPSLVLVWPSNCACMNRQCKG
jgi:hypothetical protein